MGPTTRTGVREVPRRSPAHVCGVLLALGLALAPALASAAGRVALVVGNGAYAAVGALPNPGNDAADVSAALGRLGFDVTTVRDADRVALTEALRAFTRKSAGADVALVFYAGHGLEMDGVNYLVPVDARLERDTDVRFETIALDDVLAVTEGAALRLVILDACRNNPLARSMRRTRPDRSVSRGSFGELGEDLLGDETLVAYAAAAGTTADDGEGRNSPYTAALLAHLEQPLELLTLFRRVRAGVLAATSGRQRPHEYQSLVGEHYLGGTPAPLQSATAAALRQETVFWESIRESTNPADFEAYLEQYPAGAYVRLAANREASLRTAAAAPPVPDPPRPDPSPLRPPGDGEVFRDCETCPELVVVPAGTFTMGSDPRDEASQVDERPRHQVEIGSFALGQYEVTLGEYAAFAAATNRASESGCDVMSVNRERGQEWNDSPGRSWRDPGFRQSNGEPVLCVNWADAQAYVEWLSATTGQAYRLPSEAEWEYAARAGTTTRWPWGDDADAQCAHANGLDTSFAEAHPLDGPGWVLAGCDDRVVRTAPVGSYAPNAFGVYDMAGNVWEWVTDCWHENYARAPRDGSAWRNGRDCGRRVLRGGSWGSPPAFLRSANRVRDDAGARSDEVGFRVARTLD